MQSKRNPSQDVILHVHAKGPSQDSPPAEKVILKLLQLGAVDDFEIRRVGYGKIKWEGAIDLLGVNLDTDVLICENENGKPEVAVYHDRDDRKPARGEKLNRPAVITLEKVHAGS